MDAGTRIDSGRKGATVEVRGVRQLVVEFEEGTSWLGRDREANVVYEQASGQGFARQDCGNAIGANRARKRFLACGKNEATFQRNLYEAKRSDLRVASQLQST